MSKSVTKLTITLTRLLRRYRVVATFVVIGLIGAALIVRFGDTRFFVAQPHFDVPPAATTTAATTTGPHVGAAQPVHISIPAAHISADFESPLGVQANGEIDKPKTYTHVAYYKYGPTPGQIGPAVILGHVDSYQGPGVFFYLGQIKKGDDIIIDRADGTRLYFTIQSYERVFQSRFPTNQVYGNINYAGLRLITCTGTYSHSAERYDKNLIVYARLAYATTTPVQ